MGSAYFFGSIFVFVFGVGFVVPRYSVHMPWQASRSVALLFFSSAPELWISVKNLTQRAAYNPPKVRSTGNDLLHRWKIKVFEGI